MEKVVTKIGNVTIERRSKPQQQKGPADVSVGGNLQLQNIPPELSKTEEAKSLPEPNFNKQDQSGLNAKLPYIQKIIQRGNVDIKKLGGSDAICPGNPLDNKSQETAQRSDNNCQQKENAMPDVKILETKESGVSLQKVARVDSAQSFASIGNQSQSKNILNGPDLSKFVGISIERIKRADSELQTSKQPVENVSKPLVSNPSMKSPPVNDSEVKPYELSDEELEDSYDEGDFEGEAVPLDDDIEMPEEFTKPPTNPVVPSQASVKLEPDEVTLSEDESVKKDAEEVDDIEEVEEMEDVEEIEDEEEMGVEDEDETIRRELDMSVKEEGVEEDGGPKQSDIEDLACTDLVELMQKGEIEGEIEDVKDEEMINESENKGEKKRKAEDGEDENEEGGKKSKEEEGGPKKKKKKKRKKTENKDGEAGGGEEDEEEEEDDEEEGEDEEGKDKNIDKSKVTNANLRKNIREVMDETKLDEATLSAQRQEAERLKRLQEQQRIIREVQRQIALNRQNQKSQNKVLSLLQGNSQTSILKTSSATPQTQSAQAKTQNSVLVKLSNGEQTSLNNKKMMELLKNSKNKTILGKPPIAKTLLKQGMVTPSVTIAPIAKKEPVVDDKKKKKDVVTLSSDSEDDCIVLSDEDESEPEEDPTNSGMHTNDKYNIPDEKGKVIVNVGHPESESDLFLAPQIARIIKPHQIGGIRFLYDNVIESIERFSTSAGFGCILAHSMGLGKTLQIVSFSDIFLRYTSAKTILCIMPINTIQNWLAEFNMWLPKESSTEDVRCRDFDLFIVNESLKNLNARARVILDWQKSGGVLLMGYELFRLLSLKKMNKSKKKKKDPEEEDAKNRELIEEVYSALVLPGPDLVICDEGHRIKNSHATTSQALKQIRTKRRIVLTGYPLQNNLLEYWCMVDFVRPNYLGTKTEFSNMFERPIQNGQCIDSTPQDKRLMRYRAHVLHSLLEGFVQRRSHAVLQSTLPEKEEYVLLLRFTPFQRKLYDTFMNEVVRTVAVPNPLKAFAVCCKIWNHPDVLYNFLKKKGEEIDLDLEEALPPSLQIPQYPYGQSMGPDGMNPPGQMPGVPPWPRRGPGSRGGKVRQTGNRRVGRGRKPAATIPPNVTGMPEKNDSFNSGQFPPNDNFPGQQQQQQQQQQQEGLDNFQGRNYNQNQFGFVNEYNNQTGNYPNSGYNKNPLNNFEDMSSGNFQNKRFFPQNETGNQNQFGTFESGRSDGSFNPNNSSDSNMNASFDSNLNSSDSTYNQNENNKSFDFGSEFGSEFFPNNNFQNAGNNTNYPAENKTGFQGSGGSYFQNPGFRNSENFDYQSTRNNMESNFQGYDGSNANFQNSSGGNFPNSNRGEGFQDAQRPSSNFPNPGGQGNNFQDSNAGFQGTFQNSDTNFEGNRSGNFMGGQNSNFSGNNFQRQQNRASEFQGAQQNRGPNFQGQHNRGSGFQGQNTGSNFQGNYDQGFWPQSNWGYPETSKGNAEFRGNSEFMPQKFNSFEESQETKTEGKAFSSGNNSGAIYNKGNSEYSGFGKNENESKFPEFEEGKGGNKGKEEEEDKKEDGKSVEILPKKEDSSLPYDWAMDLFKTYVTGVIENSSKMEVFFHIVTESIKLGDRLLVFSQSLLTLDLIEDYLHRRNVPDKEEVWAKNRNYFRLDGSTPGLEREKLINEFNSNSNIYLFLVSTRAGSLGINLVGANRVVVFDASWNPCHDTQAVCRVYRYGQRKPCFVYRLVMDSCLEKKIYDRQVNKQGMADRVVDELNPDAHLSIKEVTNLCWDDQEDTTVKDFSHLKEKYNDEIIKILLERCSKLLSKEPFQHESLLIDRKEKKLSQAEKRLAKRSYELEKQAANQPKNIYSFFPNTGQRNFAKPIASVRPMQSEMNSRINPQLQNRSKWIPAEVWQKQGMSAQEMTLPLDVVIPTSSPEKTSIVLKAGQRVMVLKSPKGIYMQLENGKIIAIRSAFKVGQNQNGPGATPSKHDETKKESSVSITPPIKTNVGLTPKVPSQPVRPGIMKQPFMKPFTKVPDKKLPVNMAMARSRQVMGKAKPFMLNRKFESVTPDVKQRLLSGKMGFGAQQEEKFSSQGEQPAGEERTKERVEPKAEEGSFTEKKPLETTEEKTEEKQEEKAVVSDSLETLRKMRDSISEGTKREDADGEMKMNCLKNYLHNFPSHAKGSGEEGEKKIEGPTTTTTTTTATEEGKKESDNSASQQGNENVQNWLMNQSYPPMDPYGNYFPGYYAYGPGHGPMMPPYDGFYPPSNYNHPMGRNSPMVPPAGKQQCGETPKGGNTQPTQTPVQNVQNSSTPRNPPGVNTPPMYPPYPNPYPYPYNYPANPGFNNQGYPFSNQNQSGQQTAPIQNAPTGNTPAAPNSNQSSYDSSMYSAFHRPDAPFQNPENPYSTPYPRPPYPNSGTPGFFPYNHPYPNYPYGPNFNPYMHPGPGYGYPMQNPPPVNNQAQSTAAPENNNASTNANSS